MSLDLTHPLTELNPDADECRPKARLLQPVPAEPAPVAIVELHSLEFAVDLLHVLHAFSFLQELCFLCHVRRKLTNPLLERANLLLGSVNGSFELAGLSPDGFKFLALLDSRLKFHDSVGKNFQFPCDVMRWVEPLQLRFAGSQQFGLAFAGGLALLLFLHIFVSFRCWRKDLVLFNQAEACESYCVCLHSTLNAHLRKTSSGKKLMLPTSGFFSVW